MEEGTVGLCKRPAPGTGQRCSAVTASNKMPTAGRIQGLAIVLANCWHAAGGRGAHLAEPTPTHSYSS